MVLSMDIGGTFIRIAEVSGRRVKHKTVVKTPKKRKEILKTIIHLIDSYGRRGAVCISIAGFVKEGQVINSPHIDLNGFDLKKYIEKELKIHAYVQNDAKCGAVAENYYGIGRNYKNFVYICVGTGIGGAIFIDNKLYLGQSFAGEFGHMIIDKKEFEKNSSGRYFRNIFRREKEKESIKIISDNLAKGVLNIIYALDPEAVVIGGGFGSEKIDIKELRKEVKKLDIIKRKVDIERSELDSDESLIGSALQTKINF